MHTSRIPDFANQSRAGMSIWFDEMSRRGLLFHPEDAPSEIFRSDDGNPLFTQDECIKLEGILGKMFTLFGEEVCETCYPVFMKAAGHRLAA